MHKATFDGGKRRLGAIRDAELAQDAVDMGFDRALGDEERVANRLVALAFCNPLQHFLFPAGQGEAVYTASQLGRNLWRKKHSAALYGSERLQEIFTWRGLEQVPPGS